MELIEEIEKLDYSVEMFIKVDKLIDEKSDYELKKISNSKVKICVKYIRKTFDIINLPKFITDNKLNLDKKKFHRNYNNETFDESRLVLAFELYKMNQ